MSSSRSPDVEQPLILSLRDELQHNDDGSSRKSGSLRLILASASPRRKEILEMMGLKGRFQMAPSPLDESALQQELASTSIIPSDYARVLAESKARALAETLLSDESSQGSILVLGSDTIVDQAGVILEKPKDETEARDMLTRLSDDQHAVHTGVAIYRIENMATDKGTTGSIEKITSFTDTATVQFAPLDERTIEAYIKTKEPLDKAGSYGIQGIGGQFVTNVEGDFFTVMGLPMHRTSQELAQAVLRAFPERK